MAVARLAAIAGLTAVARLRGAIRTTLARRGDAGGGGAMGEITTTRGIVTTALLPVRTRGGVVVAGNFPLGASARHLYICDVC